MFLMSMGIFIISSLYRVEMESAAVLASLAASLLRPSHCLSKSASSSSHWSRSCWGGKWLTTQHRN